VKASERHLICGTTDTGKSHLVKAELAQLESKHRVHVVDCLDEYSKQQGGPCARRYEASAVAHRLPELLGRTSTSVVPMRHSPAAYASVFRMLFRLYTSKRWQAEWKRSKVVTVLVLDEVHLYNDHVTKELEQLATTGKHYGIALVLIAQRVKAIHPDVRSQCDRVVAFKQAEQLDLEALERRCGEEFVEGVRGLPPHQYLEWPSPLSGGPEQEQRHEAS
jgi:DNA helicase HerA-like ATPase